MRLEERLEKIRVLAEESTARVAVLWQNIGGEEPVFAFGADQAMVSASVIKVPILLAVLEDVRLGRRSLEERVLVPQGEILEDSQVFSREREASLEELATWMIILSDNTSTNVLMEELGMDRINAYCRSIGQRGTVLARKMLDFEAIGRGQNNYTTARDQFALYDMVVQHRLLNPELCEKALHILKKQRSFDLLQRYIWEDTPVAHKTGGLDYLCHDAGVFFLEKSAYFLGVFVQDAKEIRGDRELVGKISRLVFDHYS